MDRETFKALITLLPISELKYYHYMTDSEIKKRKRASIAHSQSMRAKDLQERTEKFLQHLQELEEKKKAEAAEKSWSRQIKKLFY